MFLKQEWEVPTPADILYFFCLKASLEQRGRGDGFYYLTRFPNTAAVIEFLHGQFQTVYVGFFPVGLFQTHRWVVAVVFQIMGWCDISAFFIVFVSVKTGIVGG